MEPRMRTYREIGNLCAAWANLESRTEALLWGVLSVDRFIGPIISWKLDLRSRWSLIIEYADRKHTEVEISELKDINNNIKSISKDRNIVIHGIVHAKFQAPSDFDKTSNLPGGNTPAFPVIREPCWTIYRGEGKGKNFKISTDAVKIIVANIQQTSQKIREFNIKHNYHLKSEFSDFVELDWPKPL